MNNYEIRKVLSVCWIIITIILIPLLFIVAEILDQFTIPVLMIIIFVICWLCWIIPYMESDYRYCNKTLKLLEIQNS